FRFIWFLSLFRALFGNRLFLIGIRGLGRIRIGRRGSRISEHITRSVRFLLVRIRIGFLLGLIRDHVLDGLGVVFLNTSFKGRRRLFSLSGRFTCYNKNKLACFDRLTWFWKLFEDGVGRIGRWPGRADLDL